GWGGGGPGVRLGAGALRCLGLCGVSGAAVSETRQGRCQRRAGAVSAWCQARCGEHGAAVSVGRGGGVVSGIGRAGGGVRLAAERLARRCQRYGAAAWCQASGVRAAVSDTRRRGGRGGVRHAAERWASEGQKEVSKKRGTPLIPANCYLP
ncbi:MAG: hypothetical protein LBK25_06165, partial [Treponema sp.]|nr:hypothetical protein [Treponema sp.]